MILKGREAPMFVVALILYGAAAVFALVASVGVGSMGPFTLQPLALACAAAGLGLCHASRTTHAHG